MRVLSQEAILIYIPFGIMIPTRACIRDTQIKSDTVWTFWPVLTILGLFEG